MFRGSSVRMAAIIVVLLCGGLHGQAAPTPGQRAGTSIDLARRELVKYCQKLGAITVESADGEVLLERDCEWVELCLAGSPKLADVHPLLPVAPAGGYVIAIRDGRLFLVGADGGALFYAVYDFLHRAGCRWLAPGFDFYGGFNEFVPASGQARVSLKEDVIAGPVLKYRKLYVEEGHSFTTENLRQLVEWMPKLRFNTLVIPIDYQGRGKVRWDNWRETLTPELKLRGIRIEVGGHGYQNYLNAKMQDGRLFRDHPEWFAVDDKGKRTASQGWVLCSSNAEAVRYLQQAVIAYLKSRPEIQVFDFWPPDGAKWCSCPACAKLGNPAERHGLLVSQMAEALKRELPNVRLECIAYATYLDPPMRTKLDKSVLVDMCPIGQSFETQIYERESSANAKYAAAVGQWNHLFEGDVSIYSYYRKYAWSSLPVVLPHYMQKDLQWYRRAGVKGVSTYCEPGDWFAYELNHYVLGHLAWNPDADVDAIMAEFCEARYGPEAALAREVFTSLEQTVRHACSLPGTSMKKPDDYEAYTRQLRDLRAKVASAGERRAGVIALRDHLRRLGLMLDYVARDMSIQQARAAGAPVAERKRLVDELVAFHGQHLGAGVFLRCSRLEGERQYRNYGIVGERR